MRDDILRKIELAKQDIEVYQRNADPSTACVTLSRLERLKEDLGMAIAHAPCRDWTIKIEEHGICYHVTNIPFEDVACIMADGYRTKRPEANVKVYKATHSQPTE